MGTCHFESDSDQNGKVQIITGACAEAAVSLCLDWLGGQGQAKK